jgi:DNA adenine methylase
MAPFLPWPGSKAKCAKAIIFEFPAEFGTYHEPFLGSGAVFFALDSKSTFPHAFQSARLADTNVNLINCWRAVKERPEHVKQMLYHCLKRNSEEFYGAMRSQLSNPSVFLYVMRAAFSSMYRENLKGQFNVPWRKQDFLGGKSISLDMEQLDLCSQYMQLKNADISVADWQITSQDAKAGDVVYFDPPYLPYTDTGFVTYVAGGFGEGQHVFLRTQARLLSERGVFVALSNSNVPASRRIYGEPFKLIDVANAVKSTATTKGQRSEGLWIWEPK